MAGLCEGCNEPPGSLKASNCHNPGDPRNETVRLTGFLEFGKDAATLPPRGFDGRLSILLNEGCDWLLTGEDKISVTAVCEKTYNTISKFNRGDFGRKYIKCLKTDDGDDDDDDDDVHRKKQAAVREEEEEEEEDEEEEEEEKEEATGIAQSPEALAC
ncbi:hypothetical protein ANN_24305 [Periplaneta americana]|uniref:Uncharacterized protein n=1 Tax=Periplaneta americana TaxID=6978 RepID=A0ABQ8S321_PERAM|nr:hypothetical protein ANN_24305 [Periplaneta americana]